MLGELLFKYRQEESLVYLQLKKEVVNVRMDLYLSAGIKIKNSDRLRSKIEMNLPVQACIVCTTVIVYKFLYSITRMFF